MKVDERSRLEDRIEDLERRITALEGGASRRPGPAGDPSVASGPEFWALSGLRERTTAPGGVLFTGAVTLPGGERYEWQQGAGAGALLGDEWSLSAPTLAALGHSVRLLLLHAVITGTRTAAELGALESLGTTGQVYHHLRQLVAAGWLRTSGRGSYAVPPERVIALLVILAAAAR